MGIQAGVTASLTGLTDQAKRDTGKVSWPWACWAGQASGRIPEPLLGAERGPTRSLAHRESWHREGQGQGPSTTCPEDGDTREGIPAPCLCVCLTSHLLLDLSVYPMLGKALS